MVTCLHGFLRVGARQYVRADQTHPQLHIGAEGGVERGIGRRLLEGRVYLRIPFLARDQTVLFVHVPRSRKSSTRLFS